MFPGSPVFANGLPGAAVTAPVVGFMRYASSNEAGPEAYRYSPTGAIAKNAGTFGAGGLIAVGGVSKPEVALVTENPMSMAVDVVVDGVKIAYAYSPVGSNISEVPNAATAPSAMTERTPDGLLTL
jgi:hypothetical protein